MLSFPVTTVNSMPLFSVTIGESIQPLSTAFASAHLQGRVRTNRPTCGKTFADANRRTPEQNGAQTAVNWTDGVRGLLASGFLRSVTICTSESDHPE